MKDIHARIEENFKNVTYKSFHLIISQMIYFTLCDCVPLIHDNESKQKAVRALTTLLLYTIITFFGTKVEKIICKTEDISTHRQSQRHSYNTSIFIIFLKIILEFLKAAMVILCLREQGLNYYYNVNYTILTGLYYILSEDFYLDIICAMIPEKLLRKFGTGNETVDNDLGKLCVYVGSSSLVILMGCVMITMTQFKGVPLISIVFAIIILPAIKMNVLYVNAVREYISFLKMFPIVGHDKLKLLEDVCPICLDEMADGSARGTPCGHTYHFTCLLRSLEVSKSCPLCKHEF